jgi:hypothetical protein
MLKGAGGRRKRGRIVFSSPIIGGSARLIEFGTGARRIVTGSPNSRGCLVEIGRLTRGRHPKKAMPEESLHELRIVQSKVPHCHSKTLARKVHDMHVIIKEWRARHRRVGILDEVPFVAIQEWHRDKKSGVVS